MISDTYIGQKVSWKSINGLLTGVVIKEQSKTYLVAIDGSEKSVPVDKRSVDKQINEREFIENYGIKK